MPTDREAITPLLTADETEYQETIRDLSAENVMLRDQLAAAQREIERLRAAARRAVEVLDTAMVRWNVAGQMAYREDARISRDELRDALAAESEGAKNT